MLIRYNGICNNCRRNTLVWAKKRNLCQPCYRKSMGWRGVTSMHKKRFGGMRDLVLKRDNYTCQDCGMTNKEHEERWNCQITIDHINMKGRYSEEVDNSLSNLRTLCLRCHGRKDGLRAHAD